MSNQRTPVSACFSTGPEGESVELTIGPVTIMVDEEDAMALLDALGELWDEDGKRADG